MMNPMTAAQDSQVQAQLAEEATLNAKGRVDGLVAQYRYLNMLATYRQGQLDTTQKGAIIAPNTLQQAFSFAIDGAVTQHSAGQDGLVLAIEHRLYHYIKDMFEHVAFAFFETSRLKDKQYLVLVFSSRKFAGLELSSKSLAIPISAKLLYDKVKGYRSLYLATAKARGQSVELLDIFPKKIAIKVV